MVDLTLYLMRHGESEVNVRKLFACRQADLPLTDTGRSQARQWADALTGVGFDAVYASPLLRARQTAEIVSSPCGLAPIHTDALREVDLGVLDGRTYEDAGQWARHEGVLGEWNLDRLDAGFEGGETLRQVGDRFAALPAECRRRGHGRVLAVGHCLLFCAVIWLLCRNRFERIDGGRMGRGCLSVIAEDGEGWRLVEFDLPPGGKD